jgi:hypothetical protein
VECEVTANLKWTIVVPVALLALGIIAVLVLDITKGGAAKPGPYLGEAKNEQFPYIPPTQTPVGAQPAATPRPTLGVPTGAQSGDPAERDLKRRSDLILLLGAAEEIKERDGAYPTTGGNVQTLCNYVNVDVGCVFSEILDPLPFDPSRDPVKNGYWYSSNGTTAKFYASVEGEIADDQKCVTQDPELVKREFLICIEAK